jgi:hypothetical protein
MNNIINSLKKQIESSKKGSLYKVYKVTDTMYIFSVVPKGEKPEEITDNFFLYLVNKNVCREFAPAENMKMFNYALKHKIYG